MWMAIMSAGQFDFNRERRRQMGKYFLMFSLALLWMPARGFAADDWTIPIGAALAGWRFSNGPEFPGATGSLEYIGNGELRLTGDFTQGGKGYVSASHAVDAPGANKLSFQIRGPLGLIGVRLNDSQGQVHQHFVAAGSGSDEWIGIDIPIIGSPESHWGGAKDGLFRGDVTGIGFAAHKNHFRKLKDSCEIRNVQLSRVAMSLEKPLDLRKFDPRKVTSNGRASIDRRDDALIIEIPGNHTAVREGVNLKPQNGLFFDLSDGSILAMDVTNLADHPIVLSCQIENCGATRYRFNAQGGRGFAPGETAELRVLYYRDGVAPDDVTFEGVQNPPEGLRGANNLDVKKVTNIMLYRESPARDLKVAVRNIRIEGPPTPIADAVKNADTFYPAIDKYGQYKHKDWPGKTRGDADFVAARKAEENDLAGNPAPSGWNRFGGWSDGPSLEATGNFYPARYNGKWYLVDPEGKLFFSHGICEIGCRERTGISLREHYFEELPDKNDPIFTGFRDTVKTAPGGDFYRRHNINPETINFLGLNVMRKYGDHWQERHRKLAHDRMRSWGINTLGNWSNPGYAQEGRTPYAIQLYCDGPVLKGHTGQWESFEDVFDPGFEPGIVQYLQRIWACAVGDPMCIGAFVDNEHRFGNDTFLAEAVLRCSAGQAAKKEFRNRLEKQYGDILKLNTAWNTGYASWDAFMNEYAIPSTDLARADLKAFNTAFVDRYFEGACNAVHRVLPGKLYLGCRFAGWPYEELVRGAAKYCDVLSFNLYWYSLADFSLPKGVDKPVIVGEFHFGTVAGGNSDAGVSGVACSCKAECADAYRFYVRSALRHPNIVGCHYYRMTDEPITGRAMDNENGGFGFVDICDRPYPEMVKAARDVAAGMYTFRSGAAAR